MNNRLKEIIRYKTHGRQKDFAELLGWSPQYIHNLLKGTSIGIQPVITILKAMPEIDARWLLLGEGNMLVGRDLKEQTLNYVKTILDLEAFLPVMSPEEVSAYERLVTSHISPSFSTEAKVRWIAKTAERQMEVASRVDEAMEKSDELCRQETAKE